MLCYYSRYVALSRCTSLEGIYITDFDPSKIECDARAVKEINRLRGKYCPELEQISEWNTYQKTCILEQKDIYMNPLKGRKGSTGLDQNKLPSFDYPHVARCVDQSTWLPVSLCLMFMSLSSPFENHVCFKSMFKQF